jgi:glycoprotein endo-alpha-1,2-mannosidase
MFPRVLTVLVLACALAVPAATAADARRVAIFYYPWYANPQHDGSFRHWQGSSTSAAPTGHLAAAFYPARGLYSSADGLVLAAQVAELRAAGVDVLVSSWWGRGSFEDRRLEAVRAAAAGAGLEVAVHLEPYPGRTPESTRDDVAYLREAGVREFYVYGVHERRAAEWRVVTELEGVRIHAQTAMAGYAVEGGFAGLYTYDVLAYGGGSFARICAAAHRAGIVCAPSVGPGYDARRAVGDMRVKPRRAGRTYDAMWQAVIRARASAVTITSYNEWHEGTQIEPARPYNGTNGGSYAGYVGAWGRKGTAAERAYLDRTDFWSKRFRRGARRAGA